MKHIVLTILFFGGLSSVLFAQKTVQGTVTSADDGEGLPGVNITVKGSNAGTVTDLDGKYTLEVPETANTLLFSFVGFEAQEQQIDGRSTISISLDSDIQSLSEVVVVGYGSQTKKDITGAIGTLSADLIENVPASYSFDGAIQGKMAGVNVATSSATPGAFINVNIRGTSSIGASSQPLYVIDGIPVVARNNSALNSNIEPVNPLADINPNDIESISVLKDASSAAIYGSRGANGVIIVTTKRGKAGKSKFKLGYYTGVSEIAHTPELMTSSQWIQFMNTAASFDGRGEDFWNSRLGDPNDPTLPTYNAYDYIFQTGITNNADLSLSGGGEKTKFYVAGNFFDQDGIQKGLGFTRYSGRLNVDHYVNDKLQIGVNVSVGRTTHQRTINANDEYGVVINSQAWDPTAPLQNEDGSYTNPFDYYGWWALENPLFIAEQYKNTSKTTRLLNTVFAEYEIVKGLSFRTSFSIDQYSLIDQSFTPAGGNESADGSGVYATYNDLSVLNENTLTYTTTIGDKNQLTILGGYTIQESNSEFSTIDATGFPSNQIQQISSAANSAGTANGTSFGFNSFLGRVNYDYDGRYLATVSVRSDGSSRFGENNKYATFPSASLGWVLSEEAMFDNIRSTISNLKLRASYGSVGNAEIGNFLWRGSYSLNSPYNGQGGSAPSILENPDLTWEKSVQLDIGIDLGLFNNRLGITADYFDKNTNALLLEEDVPGSTGFKTVQSNFGQINNKGFEISVNASIVKTSNFSWNLNANYTHVENKVIDVINDGQIVSRNFIIQEGLPLSQLHLIKYLGVDPLTGDAIFEDINSDGVINADDKTPVGSGNPTDFGGISNNFSYKGFELNVFFQFSTGNVIFNQGRFAYENYGSLADGIPYGNQSVESLNHWKKPGDVTNIPRPSMVSGGEANAQWQRFSTQYLEDGGYIRLKDVQLAYSLPSDLLTKIGLSSARVYIQGRNLITWTNYQGFDPEVSSNTDSQGNLNTQQGEDFGTLGQARTYTLGINIGF